MGGKILLLLAIGMLIHGCTSEQTLTNQSNLSNRTNVTEPPVQDCTGPVCGSDGITYGTDCDAGIANVSIAYNGTCMVEENCTDSDAGVDPAKKGVVAKGNVSHEDYCLDSSQLMEYACLDNDITSATLLCADGDECRDGACVQKNETPQVKEGCHGPIQADVMRQETVEFNGTNHTDYCVEFDVVKDYYCSDNKVVSINNECPPGYGCSEGHCNQLHMECTDSDNGRNVSVRGRTLVTKGLLTLFNQWDSCIDEGLLREHSCAGNGSAISEDIECGSGFQCVSDRCIKSQCSETDGGKNYYKKGTVTFDDKEYEDWCVNGHEVREYFCYGNDVDSEDHDCGPGYICDNDRCVEGYRD